MKHINAPGLVSALTLSAIVASATAGLLGIVLGITLGLSGSVVADTDVHLIVVGPQEVFKTDDFVEFNVTAFNTAVTWLTCGFFGMDGQVLGPNPCNTSIVDSTHATLTLSLNEGVNEVVPGYYTIQALACYGLGCGNRAQGTLGVEVFQNGTMTVFSHEPIEIDGVSESGLVELLIYVGMVLFGMWRGYFMVSVVGIVMFMRPLSFGWLDDLNFTFAVAFGMLFLVVHYLVDNRTVIWAPEDPEG